MTVGTNPLNPDVESYFSIRSESGRVQFAVDYNTLVTVQVSTYRHHSNPVVLEPNKRVLHYTRLLWTVEFGSNTRAKFEISRVEAVIFK